VPDSVAAEIHLGGFVDFVCARSMRRIAAVADVVSTYADSYAPERDFYGPMRRHSSKELETVTASDVHAKSANRVAQGSESTAGRWRTVGNAGRRARILPRTRVVRTGLHPPQNQRSVCAPPKAAWR
jgi:hypothetical protein